MSCMSLTHYRFFPCICLPLLFCRLKLATAQAVIYIFFKGVSVSALLICFDVLLSAQEQPKAEAKETKPAKPEDMETEPNGNVAPETTAEPVVEDPMEQ